MTCWILELLLYSPLEAAYDPGDHMLLVGPYDMVWWPVHCQGRRCRKLNSCGFISVGESRTNVVCAAAEEVILRRMEEIRISHNQKSAAHRQR